MIESTRSGIAALGEVPWGTHFCHFYETADDLSDALVAFFKAGLDNNEQCIWITSEPVSAEAARTALRCTVPDLDDRFQSGQIEILDFDAWYLRGGEQDIEAILDDWIARKERALASGYAGLRVSGNTRWIETREQWESFAAYEARVNACFREHRIVALCSYQLDHCTGADAINAIRTHEFAVMRRYGDWELIEKESVKAANEELRRANEALLDGQRRILEMVATAAPLDDTLAELIRFIEAREEGLRCGILIVSEDRAHFRRGAGPNLPEAYHRALDGTPITPPHLGPCGRAADTGIAVSVPDIANDARWIPAWRDSMLSCGLRSCRSTPIFGSDGRILAALAMYYDRPRDPLPANPQLIEIATHLAGIALERERSEAALRDSERRSRELLDALPAAIYTTDPAGRITYYNQAAVELAGRTPIPGSDEWCVSWRLYAPDGTPMPHSECPMAEALKQCQPVRGREILVERPDGKRAPVVPYPTPLHDSEGALIGAVNMLVDISERKHAEEALRASEARLAAELAATQQLQRISAELIHESGVGSLYDKLVEAAAVIMRSDFASMQLLDPERGSGGELKLIAVRGFAPEAAAFWEWVSADSASTCGLALRTGKRVIVPDIARCDLIAGTENQKAYLEAGVNAAQSTPLVSRSGRLLGMISTHWLEAHEPFETDLRRFDVLARQAADLIERAQAEAALRELNEKLEQRVAERTRALEAEVAERRKIEMALVQAQRLEAIGQLTGGVAHDFNNLLTVVIGQAESIIVAAQGDERIVRMASAAQRVAERGAQLTSQLLSFARRQQLRPEPVLVHQFMATIADLVRRTVGEAVTVHVDTDPLLWPLSTDVAQFEAALLNIAANARDAMPEGGELAIAVRNAVVGEAEARQLDVRPGDYVVVKVSDTGTGMAPEILRRCFEPFYTTKDVGKGTGLGLSQIYGFARQSDGTATADSVVGRGTTISLYLPRAEVRAIEDTPAAHDTAVIDGEGKTVLVVEDQEEIRDLIEAWLTEFGYRILTAPDGVTASRMLENGEPIDLLLTDIVMPNGMSGLELAQSARRLRPDLRTVLVSGYSRQNMVPTACEDEFVFLEKPFRQAELASTIADALKLDKRRSPAG
jgi:PAS domain S-box-containing protein